MQLTDAAALRAMLEIDRTALLVIDVQVDFAAPDGALAGTGVDMSAVESAIDRMEEVIAVARSRGMCIVFLRVITSPETDSEAVKRFNQRRGLPPATRQICRSGERGIDYYRVRPEARDLEISKLLYSGFHGTRLDEILHAQGVGSVLIVGLTTECCVDSTARDAFHFGFDVFVVSDACAAYETAMHASALDSLSRNCALLATTAATCEALREPAAGKLSNDCKLKAAVARRT
jgi:nicotinamidase-related amidase